MSWRDRDPVKKIILDAAGDHHKVTEQLSKATASDPFFPLIHKKAREFLDHAVLMKALRQVLAYEQPAKYLRFIDFFRQHLPDEELRSHVISLHQRHPWQIYINGEHLKDLFPSQYFKDLLSNNVDFLADPHLGPIFRQYYSNLQLSAVMDDMRAFLIARLESKDTAEIRIMDPKDPGFACGGMEKNYRQAALLGSGLCQINGGLLLAKVFHAKETVKAKKVAYICRNTQLTSSGQIIWSNHLYAPADGQYGVVADAIFCGKKHIIIEDLKVRPIRPLIDETSKAIFNLVGDD
jgi:hypothetical protein